jgi:hypothetical protein
MGNMWGCAVPPQYSGRILFFLEVPVSGVESDVQPYLLQGRDVTTVLDILSSHCTKDSIYTAPVACVCENAIPLRVAWAPILCPVRFMEW